MSDETSDFADEPTTTTTTTTSFTSEAIPEPITTAELEPEPEPEATTPPSETDQTLSSQESLSKFQSSIESLSSIIPSIPPSISAATSDNPALSLLHDSQTSSEIFSLLRHPNSGAGDNNLCRWLYDTFQSNDPSLQLVVLRFIPTVAGLYLSRVPLRKPLAGFEAVLLALYAHETTSRAGQPVTVNVPDLSHPSLYHESTALAKNNATALNLAVISPSLEPYGTLRSTRRARIVGVALELYYSKIYQMPIESKMDFCEFCKVWAGKDEQAQAQEEKMLVSIPVRADEGHGLDSEKEKEKEKEEGSIPLPWELLQPAVRILGHCLMGGSGSGKDKEKEKKLVEAAMGACKSLYGRSMHDIDAKGILATESLIRLGKMALESKDVVDPTEISMSNTISI